MVILDEGADLGGDGGPVKPHHEKLAHLPVKQERESDVSDDPGQSTSKTNTETPNYTEHSKPVHSHGVQKRCQCIKVLPVQILQARGKHVLLWGHAGPGVLLV